MCNLSQGIKEKAVVEGRIEGERIGEERGKRQGENIMLQLFERLISNGRMEDCQRVIRDEAYRRQMIKELEI